MDFNDTPEEAAFRAEARAFVEQYAIREDIRPPQGPERRGDYLARAKRWQKLKQEHGWACLNWPPFCLPTGLPEALARWHL